MTFQYSNLKKNTNVDHKLFYTLARNDDLLKTIAAQSSGGVVARFELENSLEVPAIDREASTDDANDPVVLASAEFVAEKDRCYSFDLWGSAVTFPPSEGNATTTFFSIILEVSVSDDDEAAEETVFSYPMQTGYRFFTKNSRLIEDGPIRGKLMAKVDDTQYKRAFNLRNMSVFSGELLDRIHHYFVIPSGKIKVNVKIARRHVRQQVFASSASKLQFIVKDIGEWIYV
jgi:hypothetical protein